MMGKAPLKSYLKDDLLAGIVVFLIALPLCLAIAQASSAPLFSGVVAGVVGGIVIGFMSKSSISVSGPAAGLVAIVIGAIEQLGAFEIFLTAVFLAGVFQLVLGFVRAGSLAAYFPTNVIEGMMAGIGITIIIKQIPDASGGWGKPVEPLGIVDADDGIPLNDILHALDWQYISPLAVGITIMGIVLLYAWSTPAFKKLKKIPAALVVVILATLINLLFNDLAPSFALADNHKVTLPVPDSFESFIGQFTFPDFSALLNGAVWSTALVIAAVASIESLLCIEAIDKLDPHKRLTPGNRELIAQGTGNAISGLIGGLPITSVIVRSTANLDAGAKTKISAIFHGVLLLICVATIPQWLNHIPKAALAAILIFTGYRLANPKVFKHMWHAGKKQFIPFIVTAVAVVSLDLLKGVGLGMIVALYFLLKHNLNNPYFFSKKEYHESDGDVIKIELAQEVSFLNKAKIKYMLSKLPPETNIVLDASNTAYIDYDVLMEIKEFRDVVAPENNIDVQFIGFDPKYGIENAHNENNDDFSDYDEFLKYYLETHPKQKTPA